MSSLPEPVQEGGSSLAPRRLSNEQFELVIRRAAELQARAAESGQEGLTETEALRIGKELGLSDGYLAQALAEVQGGTSGPPTLVDRVMGSAVIQASRVVSRAADQVKRQLEEHLVEREFFCVVRRMPERVLFEPAPGAVAAVGRAARRAFSRSVSLRVPNLEMSVQPFEEGKSYVSLATRLSGERAGYLAGGVVGGGAIGGVAAAALGIAVDPAAAALGVPLFGSGIFGMRWAYVRSAHRTQFQLEALLDRLEHGELVAPPPRWKGRGR